MVVQLSVDARNARLDSIESTTGTAPTLEIRTGAQPTNCAAGDSGTLLASMTLPSNWMNDASGGTKTLTGTWQDLNADAGGTAGHFRIKQGATCHLQGSVTATGGGGDLELSSTSISAAQAVTITGFTLTDGNA
ncbi:MAG: hypothetical protein LW837_19680 [Roseomonas sp.]|nr:hypothetical protein [Roseomonas sp.]